MPVIETAPTPQTDPNKEVLIYNPLPHDFECTYDVSGQGKPEKFTINSHEIGRFPMWLSEHIRKHLIDDLMNEFGTKPNRDDARVRYLEMIAVKV